MQNFREKNNAKISRKNGNKRCKIFAKKIMQKFREKMEIMQKIDFLITRANGS